jgi:hypothetical protein
MPANDDQFTDPFFKRFMLRPAAAPLDLGAGVQKTYPFPTLYHDVGCAIGIFFCSYEAARALMPHPKILPVRMPRNRTLVIFSCYEYRQVLKVWPYSFGYFVFSMPVTSQENQIRCSRIWGLPKVTQDVDIEVSGGDCITTARESDGSPYLALRVPTAGRPTDFDVRGALYSKLDERVLRAETSFKGRFSVTKHMRALRRPGLTPDREYLTIGNGPSAQTLRALAIEPHPFQFRYAQSMNAAFDLPQPNFSIDR